MKKKIFSIIIAVVMIVLVLPTTGIAAAPSAPDGFINVTIMKDEVSLMIQESVTATVGELKTKFVNKTALSFTPRFVFNDAELDDSKTLEESGLVNGSVIYAYEPEPEHEHDYSLYFDNGDGTHSPKCICGEVFSYFKSAHTYNAEYVDNGDGTHCPKCVCGAVSPAAEAHTFVSGVCVCGVNESVPTDNCGCFSYCGSRTLVDSVGTGGGVFWAIRIPANEFAGKYTALDGVRVFECEIPGTYYLLLFSTPCGEMITSVEGADYTQQFVTTGTSDWKKVALDTPYVLPENTDLWIVLYNDDIAYPATGCDYLGTADASWVSLDGSDWMDVSNAGLAYSWLIKADFNSDHVHSYVDGVCECTDVEPIPSCIDGWYSYCGSRNIVTSIGAGGGDIFWGIRIPADEIDGKFESLEKVNVFEYAESGPCALALCSTDPGEVIENIDNYDYLQFYSSTGSFDWNTIELDEPYELPEGKDLWIVLYTVDMFYPATCCNYVGNGDSSWISLDGLNWDNICTAGGLYYSWMIKAGFDEKQEEATTVIADGQALSVIAGDDVASVRDVFVAFGEYGDYRSVKNNLVFGVVESTLAQYEDYSRKISAAPGTYTVLIRYKDGTSSYSTVTVEASNEPAYTFDGNTASFNYGDSVKYVRFAEGEYTSSQQIKNAPGCVTYTNASTRVVDGILEKSFSGTYTFMIAYLDGTSEIVTHTFG